MASSFSTLPNELSMIIASYLCNEDLARCYGINRYFSDVALDARYAHHKLFGNGTMSLEKMVAYLTYVSQPHILRRITTLEIDASSASHYDSGLRRSLTVTAELSEESAIWGKPSKFWTPLEINISGNVSALAHDLVINVPHLHSIIVRAYNRQNNPLFFAVSSHLWRHYMNDPLNIKVRHLTFDGLTINFFQAIPALPLTSDGIHLLESLTLVVQDIYEHASCDKFDAMYQFLEILTQPDSRSQLKSLSVDFVGPKILQGVFDHVFTSLSGQYALERLRRLSITTKAGSAYRSAPALRFLDLYRKQITRLRIAPHYAAPTIHSRNGRRLGPPFIGFAPGTLEALEHLEMRSITNDPFYGMQSLQVCILNSTQRLTSLDLNDDSYPLRVADVRAISRAFTMIDTPSPNTFCTASLKTLSLHLLSLTPTHFKYLSEAHPNLGQLYLRIFAPRYPLRSYFTGYEPDLGELEDVPFSLNSDRRMEEENEFIDELERKSFDGWNLQDMSISLKGAGRRTINRLKDGLRAKLPRLKSLVVGNEIDEGSTDHLAL